jgi:signal transduction histidine kinase/ActR/RegA family two-component response regulator
LAAEVRFVSAERLEQLLGVLERMVGGEHSARAPISPAHDELDALAYAVNVLVGELDYALAALLRAKEQAESANRAKTILLRNVSHEIRTPLTAMLNMSELLRGPALDEERRQQLHERIQAQGKQLTALIENLLDLSSIESGSLALHPRPLSVRETIGNAVQGVETQLPGARVVVQPSAFLDDQLLGDHERVQQILTILLVTAARRSPAGAVTVKLARDSRPALAIDIVDSHPRRSLEEEHDLFEPFSGSDGSLGLALARRLARAMDGDVTLRHDGALRLLLPMVAESPKAESVAHSPAHGLGGLRILLAEDNQDIREATVLLLELYGARVAEARDGLEAVEMASRQPFDVVLMDMRMPRLDGVGATRRLRELGLSIPVIALTADAVDEHRDECLRAGCNAHLVKPVDSELLVAIVDKLSKQEDAEESSG